MSMPLSHRIQVRQMLLESLTNLLYLAGNVDFNRKHNANRHVLMVSYQMGMLRLPLVQQLSCNLRLPLLVIRNRRDTSHVYSQLY